MMFLASWLNFGISFFTHIEAMASLARFFSDVFAVQERFKVQMAHWPHGWWAGLDRGSNGPGYLEE